jgi:quinol monooxygenase YgiN
MSKVIVLVTFELHADDAAAMKALAATMQAATQQEPGCLQYVFGQELAHPERFQLSEVWRDQRALDAHFETPHMATFRRGLQGLRLVRRVATSYTVAHEGDPLRGR